MNEVVSLFIREQAFYLLGWDGTCQLSATFERLADRATPEGVRFQDGYGMAAGV